MKIKNLKIKIAIALTLVVAGFVGLKSLPTSEKINYVAENTATNTEKDNSTVAVVAESEDTTQEDAILYDEEDEYVFVLGFNQDILPKMEKDISYINDSIKEEVSLYKTSYINKINEYILPKVIEINKASNILIFDAKGKKLKNIFFEFLFFSKLNQLNNEFNTQAI